MQCYFDKPQIVTGDFSNFTEQVHGREFNSTLFYLKHEKWVQFLTLPHFDAIAKNQLPF